MATDETTSTGADDRAASTPPRKPLFDHPMALLVLITVTVGLLAGFTTLQIRSSDTGGDACSSTLGAFRVYMAQTAPPSIFDTVAWDDLTVRYNDVFTVCEVEVAGEFTELEFDPWAEPALSAFDSVAEEQQQSSTASPDTGTTDPVLADTTTTPTTQVEDLAETPTQPAPDTAVDGEDTDAANAQDDETAALDDASSTAVRASSSQESDDVDSDVHAVATRLVDAQRLAGAQECPQRGIFDILPVKEEGIKVVWWRMSCDGGLVSCSGRIVVADDGSYSSERGSCTDGVVQVTFIADSYE